MDFNRLFGKGISYSHINDNKLEEQLEELRTIIETRRKVKLSKESKDKKEEIFKKIEEFIYNEDLKKT